MTDVAKPPEKVEKLHPKPAEKGQLQKKMADVPPPSGKATPEAGSADQSVKRALQPREVSQKTEPEANVARSAEARLRSRYTTIDKVKGTEIQQYDPSDKKNQEILDQAEQNLGKRKLDKVAPEEWTNEEIEALGVESAVQIMKDSGEYSYIEPMGGRNKADILALRKDGKLCVVECKGHVADAKDAGYISKKGSKAGNLASETKGGRIYFENEPGWLERNRKSMDQHLQKKLDDPSIPAGEKAKCQRLRDALHDTEFDKQGTYHRITVTAGPRAEYGNTTEYQDKVKPEKMIQVRLRLKA